MVRMVIEPYDSGEVMFGLTRGMVCNHPVPNGVKMDAPLELLLTVCVHGHSISCGGKDKESKKWYTLTVLSRHFSRDI